MMDMDEDIDPALQLSTPWRRCCPDVIGRAIEEALRATIYIVHEAGPTGFVLKQEGEPKKVKVFLGDQHNCSCALFRKKREVCLHILWILLKKFRVPRENPVIWQLGLIEREINEVLLGHLRKQSPVHSNPQQLSDKETVQRDIGPDDICPICQDELLNSASQKTLTFCKYSCGKSVHLKCMKIWAEHQKSTNGESVIRCPLCRENFGPITEMPSKSPRRVRAEKAFLHLGMACMHCHVCPIAGKCYRCCQCASYYLCHACFSSNQVHLLHSFEMRQHCNQPWRDAERPREATAIPQSDSPALPPALINSLQSRSLTENDYEILLQLDNSAVSAGSVVTPPTGGGGGGGVASQSRSGSVYQQHRQSVPERVINSFHVEPLDGNHPLITGRDSCQICYCVYNRGDWIRKLPCKHKFHRECIDEWLRSNHVTCPIDGLAVYDPTHQHRQRSTGTGRGRLLPLRTHHHQQQRRRRSTARSNRSRQLAPLSQAAAHQQSRIVENGGSSSGVASNLVPEEQAEFSVSGQSIIGGGGGGAASAAKRNSAKGKKVSGLRRGTSSGHPPSKKPLTGKATLLPKLEQSTSNSVTHISAQSAKQATAAVDSVISLPKINSSSNTLLSQNPSDSDIRFKRLTIQIPSVSGDNVHIPHSTTRDLEKLPSKVSSSYHHSNTNSRVQSTASSSLSSKSRNRSLIEQLSDHSLLAPICNSYGGASQPTRQKSDEELIEGPPHKSSKANNEKLIEGSPRRESSKGDSTSIHGGVHHREDSEKDEGMISLAVMPVTGNLSALMRFNGTSSLHSLPPSMGGARRLRRGSLVMPGDKPMKTCISLRESASGLLDSSLQVSTFKLSPPAVAQEHSSIILSNTHNSHLTS